MLARFPWDKPDAVVTVRERDLRSANMTLGGLLADLSHAWTVREYRSTGEIILERRAR